VTTDVNADPTHTGPTDPAALPSVGVVIPTRNRPMLVRRALEAVLAQDYAGRMRIIVVFDGTRADHGLRGTESRPVLALANWRTPGLAGTRNTGLLGLDTDLVAFCDDAHQWHPDKLTAQVDALLAAPSSTEFVTCATEVKHGERCEPQPLGTASMRLPDLVHARIPVPRSSTFLARRAAMTGPLGLLAEEAPGSRNEDWDLLLRAAKRAPIVHVDRPLVRVPAPPRAHFGYEYASKIAALRWMMSRHPEIRGCRPGAARAYGQLARWSALTGNRRDAWAFSREAVRSNWREPRNALAIAAASGVVNTRLLGLIEGRPEF